MTPFKTILLSLLVSLTACVCFHWPCMVWFVAYFAIGALVGQASKRAGRCDDIPIFFLWPIGFIIIFATDDLPKVMSYIIPGYKINLEIEKDENEK